MYGVSHLLSTSQCPLRVPSFSVTPTSETDWPYDSAFASHHSNLSKWIVTGGSRRVPLTSTSNRITLPANRRPIQSKCSPRLLQPDCARMKQEDCLPRIFLPQHNAAYHHLRTLYLTVISGTASSQHPMISPRDLTGRIGVIMYCVLKGSIPLVADPFPPKFEFSCFVEVVYSVLLNCLGTWVR